MALTTTATGSLSQDAVDFFIRAKLEEHSQVDYIFRSILEKDPLPQGEGRNYKFVRIPRINLAGELTEGVPPAEEQMDAEFITATATQYGQQVSISDVVDLTLKHPFAQRAMEELAESAARKDDALIQKVLAGTTNVFYGGGKASRSLLVAADVVDTALYRNVLMQLEVGADGVDGAAPRFGDGTFMGPTYTKHIQDMLSDNDFKESAYRGTQGANDALRRGKVSVWNDVSFMKNMYGPHITELVAAGGASSATAGALIVSTAYNYGWVRRHKKRDFDENIEDDQSVSTAVGQTSLDFTAPGSASDGYEYDLYFADAAGAGGVRRLVASGLAGGSMTNIGALAPASAAAIPEAPAAGVTVYQSYVMARRAATVIDLKNLETFVNSGPEKTDPANQKTVFATKWYDTSVILNDAWIVLIEAPSAH